MSKVIEYCCICNIGKVRQINQDNFICLNKTQKPYASEDETVVSGVATTKKSRAFGVFDGMGGMESGEVASYIAADNALRYGGEKDLYNGVSSYCLETNGLICKYASSHSVDAMGTTCAMLIFKKNGFTLCNVGDSKIIRLRKKKAEQLSLDHVAAAPYGKKPPLSQYLGIPPTELVIDPYIVCEKVKKGDVYLICSDGITDMVPGETLKAILLDSRGAKKAAETLVNTALKNGGRDNVTAIVISVRNKKFSELFKNIDKKVVEDQK